MFFRLLPALALLSLLATVGCGPDYPSCGDDDDCHEGEFCVNEQCQQCRVDSHCEAGHECNDGRCDPIQDYCRSNADCGDGAGCERNRCVTQTRTEAPEPTTSEPIPDECSLEPIYFDFDSDQLPSAVRDRLQNLARCVQDGRIRGIHLTGYTDERGTEEYNLALGDRRARSVMQYLTSLGAPSANLSASSMGEEMSMGADEASWERDRKVTLTPR